MPDLTRVSIQSVVQIMLWNVDGRHQVNSRTRHRKLPENSTKIVSEDESRKLNIRVQLSCVAREFFLPYVSLLFGGAND